MQIIYFPYLSLNNQEEISFGDIKIWNFQKKASEYIKDETIRNKVQALLDTNVRGNRPIKDMGILTIGKMDFREAAPEDLIVVQELKLILFLAFLSKNNIRVNDKDAGWLIGTSENFSPIIQNFQPDSDYISEASGTIVNIQIGGYKIPEVKFKAHAYVPNPSRFAIDTELISQLLKTKKRHKKLYRRILNGSELLFQSYYNDPNISNNARILLQVAAFTILLDLQEEPLQRKVLKDVIETRLSLPTDKMKTYLYEKSKGKKEKERRSIKVMWVDRIYTLRNHIIHGERVKESDFLFFEQRHIYISPMFFVLLTKSLINEIRRNRIFFDYIKIEKNKIKNTYSFIYESNDIYPLALKAMQQLSGMKIKSKSVIS